jgi:hypothetical protein
MRNLHLLIGLLVTPFVLVYGISAIGMSHPTWLPKAHSTTERVVAVDPGEKNPRTMAEALQRREELRGALRSLRDDDGLVTFRVVRPGATYDIEVDRTAGTAAIRSRVSNFIGFLDRVHRIAGWHDHLPSGLLAFTLLGVSVALLFLGASGVYLWYVLIAERRAGWIALVVGLVYSLTLLVAIRLA